MKNIFRIQFVFLLLLTTVSCNNNTHIKKDMAGFDRAFIPVFYNTTLGDFKAAQNAMYVLRGKWQHYQSDFHPKAGESEDWKETIRMIGAWLEETECALEEGDAYRALIQLDHARYELVDLRLRANIDDYYLDYLWDFEMSMYAVIDVANDQMIDLLEFNEFEVLVKEVQMAWKDLDERDLNKRLFDLHRGKLPEWNFRKERLGHTVKLLLEAVETADRCLFADAALDIEPAYLDYMAMFGNFEAVETYYALKK